MVTDCHDDRPSVSGTPGWGTAHRDLDIADSPCMSRNNEIGAQPSTSREPRWENPVWIKSTAEYGTA
jgi:hypothetical protein